MTIFYYTFIYSGEIRNLEPEKKSDWVWMHILDLIDRDDTFLALSKAADEVDALL